jgi:dTDP-4-amino-4,6-dideoxy-D-galactose acyltransferase
MSACLTPRLWDSEFFGFPVAEINVPQINAREFDEGLLTAALLQAKWAGFELVYWKSDDRGEVPGGLLERFTGQLVDRRLIYRLSFDHAVDESMPATVTEYPVASATDELVQLAIAAGEFSRFKIDRHFPRRLFEALYRTWIERSSLHQIADAVLIARSDIGRVSGMSTISAQPQSGTIGLISVREDARGRGVGRALLAASHRWMADHGIGESSVTTQECNRAACTLYERCGYRVAERSLFYHFWPMK